MSTCCCRSCNERNPECHAKSEKYLAFVLENEKTKQRRHDAYMLNCFSFESVMRAVYDKNNIHHNDFGYCVRTKRKRGLT